MKRVSGWILLFALSVWLMAPAYAVSAHASAAILVDVESRRVLYEQNIHEPRHIASITKLMTALVATEQIEDLDREITVPSECVGIEGSSIYLQPNERISLRGLLYGLLLQSGNDAAAAIAIHVAGSVDAFADLMNQKARELGMENSSFTNPSGLSDEGHYSTAYDMALLACACLENAAVAEICATKSITVGTRTYVNHNKLLYRCEGCVGMKTGYTELAGRTLVSACARNGQTLVCVTLNDKDDWNDHEALYDFGFEVYPNRALCDSGEEVGSIPVSGSLIPSVPIITAEMTNYPLREEESLTMSMEYFQDVQVPVSLGATVGRVIWSLDGEPVAETELICGADVPLNLAERSGIRDRISRWLGR